MFTNLNIELLFHFEVQYVIAVNAVNLTNTTRA